MLLGVSTTLVLGGCGETTTDDGGGVSSSGSDTVRVILHGSGGHGSRPETTVDPVLLAAATVLRRGSDPADITAALGLMLDSPGFTGQLLCMDGGQHLAWQTPDVLGVE